MDFNTGDELICPGCLGKATVTKVEFEGVTIRCEDKNVETRIPLTHVERLKPWSEEEAKAMQAARDEEDAAQVAGLIEKLAPAMARLTPPSVRDVAWIRSRAYATLSDGSVWSVDVGALNPAWAKLVDAIPETQMRAVVVNLPLSGVVGRKVVDGQEGGPHRDSAGNPLPG